MTTEQEKFLTDFADAELAKIQAEQQRIIVETERQATMAAKEAALEELLDRQEAEKATLLASFDV